MKSAIQEAEERMREALNALIYAMDDPDSVGLESARDRVVSAFDALCDAVEHPF